VEMAECTRSAALQVVDIFFERFESWHGMLEGAFKKRANTDPHSDETRSIGEDGLKFISRTHSRPGTSLRHIRIVGTVSL